MIVRQGSSLATRQAKFQQALAFYQKGEVSQAQTLLNKILKMQPNHYDALSLSSLIAYQTKDYQLAISLLDRSIRIQPSPAAYSNRGIAFHELGQLDMAVASFDKAIFLQPHFP